MKILVGYVLALAVMFGGFVTGWTWLTTEPVTEPVRKPVVTKVVQPAPVVERDETVTFPDPPPRPVTTAVQDTVAPPTATPSVTTAINAASSPDASSLSAFAKVSEKAADKVEPPQAEPAKPVARVAKKKRKPQPRYEVMIEQTVQLPDGRIISRLIPMSARSANAYAQYQYR